MNRLMLVTLCYLASFLLSAVAIGQEIKEANQYTLQGKGLSISYSSTSITGKPMLSVERNGKTKDYRGDEIRSVTTDIGTLVSVDLEAVPDSHVIKLTFAVPPVNVSGKTESIKTFAVLATHHTSIGGPHLVKGPLITYEIVALNGEATHVQP